MSGPNDPEESEMYQHRGVRDVLAYHRRDLPCWAIPKPKIEHQRELIMTKQTVDAVAAWRALKPSEKLRIRQSVVIDRVVASMAMEGEPVSQKWIDQAKARRAQLVASTPPEVH